MRELDKYFEEKSCSEKERATILGSQRFTAGLSVLPTR